MAIDINDIVKQVTAGTDTSTSGVSVSSGASAKVKSGSEQIYFPNHCIQ